MIVAFTILFILAYALFIAFGYIDVMIIASFVFMAFSLIMTILTLAKNNRSEGIQWLLYTILFAISWAAFVVIATSWYSDGVT